MQTKSFETLVEEAKDALHRLSNAELSLKESLEIYKKGLASLDEAQELLEKTKLEYQELSVKKDLV